MNAPFLLAGAWAREQRGRAVLTVAAIAIACSLVVFTVTAYRAAVERSAGFADALMGPYELMVLPLFGVEPLIPTALEDELRQDPAVRGIDRTRLIHGNVEDAADTTYYDSWRVAFIATVDGRAPVDLAEGEWPSHREGEIAGCLSGGLARRWRVGLGDRMPMHGPAGEHELVIVGLTDEVLAHPEASGVFVAPATLEAIAGGTITADRLMVDLHDSADPAAVLAAWEARLAAADPPTLGRDLSAFGSELAATDAVSRLRSTGAAGSLVVLLAAAFIVYTSMAAGAGERSRQLALLRCVGATRGQLVGAVLLESCLLAVVGCLLGVPLGWLWLQGLALAQQELFGGLIIPDLGGVIAALLSALACAIAAGLGPALTAGRVSPIEAMARAEQQTRGPHAATRGMIAALLLVVGIASVTLGAAGSLSTVAATTLVGLACLALSALLAAPALLRLCELFGGGPLARLLGLPAGLLRHQGGAHLSRATGTVLTLAICFGLSICMNVWGRSMVGPFMPSPELPEQVISLLPGGAPTAEAGRVAQMPGVDGERVLPLKVEQLLLGRSLIGRTGGDPNAMSIQLIGLEPGVLAQGDDPLLPVESSLSDDELAAALREPGSCLVPPTFLQRFGFAVGDRFPLMGVGDVSEEIELRIAGTATLPGWHWITKMGRMRSLGGRPMAPLLVSNATADYLGVNRVRHWLADTTTDFDRATLRKELVAFAEAHAGSYESAHFGPGMSGQPSVKMIATGEVARRMRERSDGVIWVLGAIPLASLLVAALGVANAVAMGIRVRGWEFGVMRTVGCEQRHLGRLVLAETFMLAMAAGVIGVVYGIAAAWSAIGLSIQAFGAGGSAPPLILPWLDMLIAWLVTASAALLASLLPVRRLARRETLDLLQAGRASA